MKTIPIALCALLSGCLTAGDDPDSGPALDLISLGSNDAGDDGGQDADTNSGAEPGDTSKRRTLLDAAGDGYSMDAMDAAESIDDCMVEWSAAEAFLREKCAGCHDSPATVPVAFAGFGNVLNRVGLRDGTRVEPGNPDDSKIYQRIYRDEMPPGGGSMSEATLVAEWIACEGDGAKMGDDDGGSDVAGLPLPTPGGDGYYDGPGLPNSMIYQMLTSTVGNRNLADRKNLRWITFANTHNLDEPGLDHQARNLRMLLNGVSRGTAIHFGRWLDTEHIILEIDLRALDWDAAIWDAISDEFPYAVKYDDNNFEFPYREFDAQRLRDEVGAEVPYLPADWFLTNVSRPPLYRIVLRQPETIQELAAQQGIDVDQETVDLQIIRAGFNDSGVSYANRIIERHNNHLTGGYFWISADFRESTSGKNIFEDPLNPLFDGGEIIYSLPNSLQAYALSNAAGVLVDVADSDIVVDPRARNGAIENGISCAGGCHSGVGMIKVSDQIHDYVQEFGVFDAADRQEILQIYPGNEVLNSQFDADIAFFQGAQDKIGTPAELTNTLWAIVAKYDNTLNLALVASTIGIPEQKFRNLINANPSLYPNAISALRADVVRIQRDALDDLFPEIIEALGIGEAFCRDGGNGCRALSAAR